MITLPSSEYFTLRPIGSGIYAAIAKEGSPAYSNAGVVDTGDHILVYDTFNTFRAALDLYRDIEIITKRLANYIVISHSHTDHWMGNQAFADHATILASRQTTDAMVEWAKEFAEDKTNPENYKQIMRETKARLSMAEDPRLMAHLSWTLAIQQHEYENLLETHLHLPNQSFDSKLDIYGAEALVKIMTLGTGHTACDTILVLPEDRIAFIGDIGFFKTHPYLGDSNPEQWVVTLDELVSSKISIFVPGHGPVGTKADLKALKAYILNLQAMVAAVVNCGGSEDDAASQPVPDFAEDWAGFGRFENSMRYLYRRQVNQDKASDSQADLSRIMKRKAEASGYILDGVEISVTNSNQNQDPPELL
jgi:glyoxylase-like metal-dependent hydrolase (beta-lactamase superfamily II)